MKIKYVSQQSGLQIKLKQYIQIHKKNLGVWAVEDNNNNNNNIKITVKQKQIVDHMSMTPTVSISVR